METNHPEAITVELGGKQRIIKLSVGAFRLAKLKHGAEFTLREMSNPGPGTIAQFAWVGLLPDEPNLTEEDAMVMLAQAPDQTALLKKVAAAIEGMSQSIEAAFPDAKAARGKK